MTLFIYILKAQIIYPGKPFELNRGHGGFGKLDKT